jgi:hypothetical protein
VSKDKEELGEQIKDLQQRLKKEQTRARKLMEERDEWQVIACGSGFRV